MKHIVAIIIFSLIPFILAGQEQKIQVTIGNSILHGILKDGVAKKPDEYLHVIDVSASDDGIINKIDFESNKDLKTPIIINITRTESEIKIVTGAKSQIVDSIRLDAGLISIVGPHYTRKRTEYLDVRITPQDGVIYETSEIILTNQSPGELKELFVKKPSEFNALRYENNVLLVDYRKENNINFKYVYMNQLGISHIVFYYPSGSDKYDKYSPPIEVKGGHLHSEDARVNVINYFILQAASSTLSEILFPEIFLDVRNATKVK
jgi:hypothetical protein